MKISKFEIKNFKGITKTSINLADDVPGHICMLIGLNESGKTTILEGISHFVNEDEAAASLVKTVHQKSSTQDIIPKDKKEAFSGRISISAMAHMEEEDIEALRIMFHEKFSLQLDETSLPKNFSVERYYNFEDSTYKKGGQNWQVNFQLKRRGAKKFKLYDGFDSDDNDGFDVWLAGADFLESRMPSIVYFPTLIFQFPERIYLGEGGDKINAYYAKVIQDVLDSQGDGLSIERHILARINKVKMKAESEPSSNFIAMLFGGDERKQIDAVLQKIAVEMSKVIFGAWSDILGKKIDGKRVQIDWNIDYSKNNSPYLEVSIIDGQIKYSISERSLGFRWFFSFLLFTQFRRDRKGVGPTIFLFDEPASNLHAKAQLRLLQSFEKIAGGGTFIVYSTHSHYMINPLWLEKAYIVQNKASDYDADSEAGEFVTRKTDINAEKYKTFVSENPSKTTYYQPVLDALDVQFSPLIKASKAVIVEGKFDFYPFLYFKERFCGNAEYDVFPGSGAGHSGTLINLFRGWGVNFYIILDDDRSGRGAKAKYLSEYLVSEDDLDTIAKFESSLNGKEFENFYQNDVIDVVKSAFSKEKPDKKHFSLFFQDLLVQGRFVEFAETEAKIKPLFDRLESKFFKQ